MTSTYDMLKARREYMHRHREERSDAAIQPKRHGRGIVLLRRRLGALDCFAFGSQ